MLNAFEDLKDINDIFYWIKLIVVLHSFNSILPIKRLWEVEDKEIKVFLKKKSKEKGKKWLLIKTKCQVMILIGKKYNKNIIIFSYHVNIFL